MFTLRQKSAYRHRGLLLFLGLLDFFIAANLAFSHGVSPAVASHRIALHCGGIAALAWHLARHTPRSLA